MDDQEQKPRENIGPFLGPDVLLPTRLRPLGSEPPRPEPDDGDEPPPRVSRPGPLKRLWWRLTGRGPSAA
jgi:hypothetical protein